MPRNNTNIIAELSILNELSSLAFAGSKSRLAREAVEKATRIFGVSYFAVISKIQGKNQLIAFSGFSCPDQALLKILRPNIKSMSIDHLNNLENRIRFVFNQNIENEDIIYFEQSSPINRQTRRLYSIFARRLKDCLSALRLENKQKEIEKNLRENEERINRQRLALAYLATETSIAKGDLKTAFEKITKVIAEALLVERASIWLLSNDGKYIICQVLYETSNNGFSSGQQLKTKDFPNYLKYIKTGMSINAMDTISDPRTSELQSFYLRPLGITSLLDSAIRKGDKLAGILRAEHTGSPRAFHFDEEAFVNTSAALTAKAIANAEHQTVITALKESERMLRESQEVAGIGSYVVNIATNTVKSSTVLIKLLGIPDESTYSLSLWTEIIKPDWRDKVLNAREKAMQNLNKPFDMEYPIIRLTDKQERWMRDIGRFETDEYGNLFKQTGTIQDITDLKHSQEERESLNMQIMNAQKMEAIGRLAGGIAHDFNNNLSVILGYADLLSYGMTPESELLPYLQEIKKSAEHSAELTRQLLTFARRQPINVKVINLSDTIDNIMKMLKRMIRENIELSWSPNKDLWNIKMDPVQVSQVLANLCVNSKDAIQQSGWIKIESKNISLNKGDYVMLSVSDNGAGMDSNTINRIFDPFFTTKEIGKGTGLGLATVYGIINQNKGFIEVNSKPGKGTTFNIFIPRHLPETKTIPAGPIKKTPLEGKETILFVEDEPAILNMGSNILKNLGYNIFKASNPTQAIETANSFNGTIHALVTDLIMPEMNGRELGQVLVSQFPKIKVIYMSGYPVDKTTLKDMLGPDVNFIQKPFSLKDLAHTIRTVLDGTAHQENI